MPHPPQRRPAVAKAIDTPAKILSLSLPRLSFFPKGPGPGLKFYVILIGILPSVFATFYISFAVLEGGYYMFDAEVLNQHRALNMIAGVLSFGIVTVMAYVIRAIWQEKKGRIGFIAMLVVLLAVLGWDWFFTQSLRNAIMQPLSRADILAIAERKLGPDNFRYRARTLTVLTTLPETYPVDRFTATNLGPQICVEWGGLFAGPVDGLRIEATSETEETVVISVPRTACREWYTQHRSLARRPNRFFPVSEA